MITVTSRTTEIETKYVEKDIVCHIEEKDIISKLKDDIELYIPTIGRVKWTAKCNRLMAVDCAERVIHFWSEKYPEDDRPQKAIAAARDFANGLIKKDKLEEARKAVSAASNGVYGVELCAILAARYTTHGTHPQLSADCAAYACAFSDVITHEASLLAENKERDWQLAHFMECAAKNALPVEEPANRSPVC